MTKRVINDAKIAWGEFRKKHKLSQDAIVYADQLFNTNSALRTYIIPALELLKKNHFEKIGIYNIDTELKILKEERKFKNKYERARKSFFDMESLSKDNRRKKVIMVLALKKLKTLGYEKYKINKKGMWAKNVTIDEELTDLEMMEKDGKFY